MRQGSAPKVRVRVMVPVVIVWATVRLCLNGSQFYGYCRVTGWVRNCKVRDSNCQGHKLFIDFLSVAFVIHNSVSEELVNALINDCSCYSCCFCCY